MRLESGTGEQNTWGNGQRARSWAEHYHQASGYAAWSKSKPAKHASIQIKSRNKMKFSVAQD